MFLLTDVPVEVMVYFVVSLQKVRISNYVTHPRSIKFWFASSKFGNGRYQLSNSSSHR